MTTSELQAYVEDNGCVLWKTKPNNHFYRNVIKGSNSGLPILLNDRHLQENTVVAVCLELQIPVPNGFEEAEKRFQRVKIHASSIVKKNKK